MMIIPAIDLMEGRVVRLRRGKPETKIEYNMFGDPVSIARLWEEQGAEYVQIIDLDAALGRGSNRGLVRRIVRELDITCQVGGGIRTLNTARGMLEDGVGRLIVGSMAVENPDAVETLIEEYGEGRVAVSLDHLAGEVRIHGWKTGTGLDIDEALTQFSGRGVEWFLVTSVERDGTLEGPDLRTLRRIAGKNRIIAGGGIGSLDDLVDLRETRVDAAVVGRALYEGRFTLPQALSKIGRG